MLRYWKWSFNKYLDENDLIVYFEHGYKTATSFVADSTSWMVGSKHNPAHFKLASLALIQSDVTMWKLAATLHNLPPYTLKAWSKTWIIRIIFSLIVCCRMWCYILLDTALSCSWTRQTRNVSLRKQIYVHSYTISCCCISIGESSKNQVNFFFYSPSNKFCYFQLKVVQMFQYFQVSKGSIQFHFLVSVSLRSNKRVECSVISGRLASVNFN